MGLPLKKVSFDVEIDQGFADVKITQFYENPKDNALEILFRMPHSDTFTITKIQATFFLEDGSHKMLETKVEARVKAEQKYDDAIA